MEFWNLDRIPIEGEDPDALRMRLVRTDPLAIEAIASASASQNGVVWYGLDARAQQVWRDKVIERLDLYATVQATLGGL